MNNRFLARIPLFWKFQIFGWLLFCGITFPLKLEIGGSLQSALLLLIVRDGSSFALTLGLRHIYNRFWSDQALLMVIVAIPSCIVSGMAQTAFTIAFRSALPIQSEFHFVHVSVLDVLYERTGLLFGWSSLYFGIRHALQGMQRKLDLAFARTAQSDAEIRMLRSLFNAHFLLNSLNTVMNTLERQRPGAREMVQALSDHLNYSLRHRSDDLVLLGEEIAALESYLVLERARLGSDLDFAHKIEGETRFARVPGFILQPLVENGIKYGRKTCPGKVLVRLIVQQEENTIVIQVFNTGRWIDPDPERKSGGVGLEAIKGKLLWLYPNQHSISSFEEEGWVTVQVKVPFAS